MHAANAAGISKQYQQKPPAPAKPPVSKDRAYNGKYALPDPKPYQYKPKDGFSPNTDVYASLQRRPPSRTGPPQSQPMYNNVPAYRAPPAPMAPMAPMTPAPPKAPQQYKKPVDYRRVRLPTLLRSRFTIANFLQPPTQTPPPIQLQPKPLSQPAPKAQAPVANMMAANSTPTSSCPPSSVRSSASSSHVTITRDDKRGFSKLDIPAHWHYLHQAEKERPKLYQSPYAADGPSSNVSSPAHETASDTDRAAPGLSESFLMQRTPSQQEKVRGHIRTVSDTRVKMQQEKIRQQQEELRRLAQKREQQEQQLRQERQALSSTNGTSLSTTSHRHQGPLPNHQLPPVHSYNDFATSYNHYPDPYASSYHPHAHSPATYSNPYTAPSPHPTHHHSNSNHRLPSPWSNTTPPGSAGGLQYQSPQEFKMQMQREAQQHSEWTTFKSQQNDFSNFYRGLQTAAQQHPDDANVGGSAGAGVGSGGGAGSPLKYEFAGGGGEMLPMMRDA